MCGISAIVDVSRDGAPIAPALREAHEALRHRGPDGEAFLWVMPDGGVERVSTPAPDADDFPRAVAGIGFHQLTIHDPSLSARQPLGTVDGRHWITMNGEIYNAPDLRAQLQSKGHAFRTRVDTEVALAAYLEWGMECFERFNGMWAMLLVDAERRTLIGCRDRLGIKPLYYAEDPTRLILASEPQAVVRARTAKPRAHAPRLRDFLVGGAYASGHGSFFEGVDLVPAASAFTVDLRESRLVPLSFRRYWSLNPSAAADAGVPSFVDARDHVRALLDSSITMQCQASVKVGCLLSGGLDTSIVARTLGNQALERGDGPVPAYSIVYNEPAMSEEPFIWAALRGGGLQGHSYRLTPWQAWDDIDAVVRVQGQPLLGQDLIAQYHAYRLARQDGATVVLEGQGADELLAGMPSYASALLDELWQQRRFIALLAESGGQARRAGRGRWRGLRQLVRWSIGHRRWRRPSRPAWLRVEASAMDGQEGTSGGTSQIRTPTLNHHLLQLVTRTNLPAVLPFQDRSSMAHGVESRVPFLDHRFVEYCFTLPSSYKVHRGVRKRVLYEAARGLVPDVILNRRDKKTFVSVAGWMPLRSHGAALRRMVSGLAASTWCEPRALSAFVEGFLRGDHDDSAGVWRLYTVWRWRELFSVE